MSERKKANESKLNQTKKRKQDAVEAGLDIPTAAQTDGEEEGVEASDPKRLREGSSSSLTSNLGASHKNTDKTKNLKEAPSDSFGDASTPVKKGSKPPSLIPAPEQSKGATEKTPEVSKSPPPHTQPSASAIFTEPMDTSVDETPGTTLVADSTSGDQSQGKLLDQMLEEIYEDFRHQKETANVILNGLTNSSLNDREFRVSGLVLGLWGIHCLPGMEGDKEILGLRDSINVKVWFRFLHQEEQQDDKLELPPVINSPCYYIRVASAVNTMRVIKGVSFDKLETHFKEVITNGRISEYPHYSILFVYHYMQRLCIKKPKSLVKGIFKSLSLPEPITFMVVFNAVKAYVNESLTPSCSLCYERAWIQRRDRFFTLITKMIMDDDFVHPLKFLMQNFCEFASESDVILTLNYNELDSKRIFIHREILRYWGLERMESDYKKTVADPRDQSFKYTVWLLYRDDRLTESILMKHLKGIEECLSYLGFGHTGKILNFDVQRMEAQLEEERGQKKTTVLHYYLKKHYIWTHNTSVLATLSVMTMQHLTGHDNLYLPEIEILELSIRWAKLQPDSKVSLSAVIDLIRLDRLDKNELMTIVCGEDRKFLDESKRLNMISAVSEYEHLRFTNPNYIPSSKCRQPLP